MELKNLFLATTIALASSSAIAADWDVSLYADFLKSATGKDSLAAWEFMEGGRSLGLHAATRINDDWNLRFEYAFTKLDVFGGRETKDTNRFGIDGIYQLDNSNAYLVAGMKRFNTTHNYFAANVGIGYGHQITEKLSWFTEANVYKDLDYGFVDQGIKFGLTYRFGEAKKSSYSASKSSLASKDEALTAEPTNTVMETNVVMADADNDGVNDSQDTCNDTKYNEVVDEKGCTVFEQVNDEVKLDVLFANNSSMVKNIDEKQVEGLVNFFETSSDVKVTIEGHASAVGNDDYNQMISLKRADRIKKILVNKYNIDENRINTVGYGSTQLLSTEKTAEANAQNRRVVILMNTNKSVPKIKR